MLWGQEKGGILKNPRTVGFHEGHKPETGKHSGAKTVWIVLNSLLASHCPLLSLFSLL